MGSTINERIRIIYKKECGSIEAFADKIGMTHGRIRNIVSRGLNPSYEVIKAIADTFEDYSMDWLIRGTGEMLKSTSIKMSNTGTGNIANTGTIKQNGITYNSDKEAALEEKCKQQQEKITDMRITMDSMQLLIKSQDTLIENYKKELKK